MGIDAEGDGTGTERKERGIDKAGVGKLCAGFEK